MTNILCIPRPQNIENASITPVSASVNTFESVLINCAIPNNFCSLLKIGTDNIDRLLSITIDSKNVVDSSEFKYEYQFLY
ncbi:hypothetical protein DERP_004578 [Dermatophagoides pteronyssinus]|uniref:Uncharacterized protein n=1 Tax=Dermatophagoides pteronyssinus TaxID=6956 RepID=A0ABQ8JPB5_DERPT|nr:hypothetical protein DERP_004578 [Dermatophagoides pteronyssinus]